MPVSGAARESPTAICHCLPAAATGAGAPGMQFLGSFAVQIPDKASMAQSAAQIPLPCYESLLPVVNRFQCLIESGYSLAASVVHHAAHKLKDNNGISSG